MKMVSVGQLSALGKSAVAVIITLAGLLNVPQVSAVVGAFFKLHPHWAFTATAITGLATLLANPQVQKVLGVTIETPEGKLTLEQTKTPPPAA